MNAIIPMLAWSIHGGNDLYIPGGIGLVVLIVIVVLVMRR
jgi:hypothetical protein